MVGYWILFGGWEISGWGFGYLNILREIFVVEEEMMWFCSLTVDAIACWCTPFCCILAALQVGLRYRGMDRVFVYL